MKLNSKEIMWVVLTKSNEVYFNAMHYTRKDAIKYAEGVCSDKWVHLKKIGFRCVKISITVNEVK